MKVTLCLLVILAAIAPIFAAPAEEVKASDAPQNDPLTPRRKEYFFAQYVKANWHKANAYCHSLGRSLITIQSQQEYLDVTEIIRNAGFYDENFWLGGSILGDTAYYWHSDNTRFRFTNWAPNQPDNAMGLESCALLWASANYRWNDANCNDGNALVMCERVL